MRRFLLPVLILMLALLLPACGANNGPQKQGTDQWGNLRVTLENVQQAEKQWSANLAVKNPTDKMQVLQYRGPFQYALIVTRDGKDVLRQEFGTLDPAKPQILNLSAGVTKNHIVVWTYLDNEGKRVEPGTYEVSILLQAITAVPVANPKAGQPTEEILGPPTVGPVQITVQ